MYKLIYSALHLVTLLPLRALYFFDDLMYFILYYVIRYRREVVRRNLLNSFPEKQLPEIKKIERQFYRHFCDIFFEAIYRLNISQEEYMKRAQIENIEAIHEVYAQGKIVILALGHLGNWEWTPVINFYVPKDSQMYAVYKQLKNKHVDKLTCQLRTIHGGGVIEMGSLIKTMLHMSKKDMKAMFLILGDQRPKRDYNRFEMEFLNQKTSVFMGIEVLAKKFDYPVYYLSSTLLKRGYYKYTFKLVTSNPLEEPEFSITEKYMRLLEEDIRNNPHLWLWTHDRWKFNRNK
ncbi:MAG: lysophospholipid acyltransferase family protein [Paludibacter sp.]|nr:lysophospholipid acyltransferase family protein [Paludibacter sp.]